MNRSRHRNRLHDATSPYLLQHADNPVDWYPWGPEALRRARETNRPIFLSIGYAACHWCHVMERESFENPRIAAQMNSDFVCIKVDREERPDLDDIYMRSVQMMSGQGGWPLTVFLTPELEPFAGGTYFPPEDRPHMPGLPRVLSHIAASWRDRRDEAVELATLLRARLQDGPGTSAAPPPDGELLERAVMSLHDRFDPNYGGFTPAPKFPNTTWLALLLRRGAAQQDDDIVGEARFTLESMAAGGIHDHVGGGFHRYATDARWLVPHFEKMLYDNALLACAYLDAYQLTDDPAHARIARSTLDWVERDMQLAEGGFASSLDADSEGIEGKYYVWSDAEIRALLGGSADVFCATYGIRPGGNWEGSNIVHLPQPLSHVAGRHETSEDDLRERLDRQLLTLRDARAERIPPALDDKVLADWNGMMIAAMARAYRVLNEPRYLESARKAAGFVWTRMRDAERLLHSHRGGHSHLLGYLDDHATMLWACIELFESCFELSWLHRARRLGDQLLELFAHPEGGFFFTGADHETLIARTRAGHDGATPSGNALAATWLQRLATLTGESRYAQAARATIDAFADPLRRAPIAHAQLLLALDAQIAEPREIVVVGSHDHPDRAASLRALWGRYAPTTTLVALDPDSEKGSEITTAVPMLRGKSETTSPGRLTFFDCRNYACRAPTECLEEVLTPRWVPAN